MKTWQSFANNTGAAEPDLRILPGNEESHMKFPLLLAFVCCATGAVASPPLTLDAGPNHRTVGLVRTITNLAGETITVTNSYVEIGSGLNYLKDGKWLPSAPTVEPDLEGAVLRNAGYSAKFKSNLNSSEPVVFTTPDGTVLRTRVTGLSYFDAASGEAVLLAATRDCEGQIAGENRVVYPQAFDDVPADVEYVMTKAGWEQNVILRADIPEPSFFGMDPQSTRLQILTEFLSPPELAGPNFTRSKDGLQDENVRFGTMLMGKGKAFLVEPRTKGAREVNISKLFKKLDDRHFLIEEMQYTNTRAQLKTLPARNVGAGIKNQRRGNGGNVLLALRGQLPATTMAMVRAGAMQVASAPLGERAGFLCDYSVSGYLTNYTFRGDATYHVSAPVYLTGHTVIQGGTVIKSSVSSDFYDASITFSDPNGVIEWKTSEFRPAVFTSRNDDTIGQIIDDSTGSPQSGDYAIALNVDWLSPELKVGIHDVRFIYSWLAFQVPQDVTLSAWNMQVVDCVIGVGFSGRVELFNLLFSRVGTVLWSFTDDISVTAEFLTVDQGSLLYWDNFSTNSQFTLRNTLLKSVTLPSIPMTQSCVVTAQQSDFAPTGAGAYYLAQNSSLRNTGVTNSLPFDIRSKTTFAPVVWSNTAASTPITLLPQAQRDTDEPDPGYHYSPIDYLACLFTITNAPLTLSNGVVVGCYDETAILLRDKAPVTSCGSPAAPNRFLDYRAVQEQPRKLGSLSNSGMNMLVPFRSGSNGAPVAVRFTEFSRMAGAATGENLYGADYWLASAMDVQDCNFYGGGVTLQAGATNALFRNNLFEHARVYLAGGSPLRFVNNTVIGKLCVWGCNQATPWEVSDNIFAGCVVGDDGDYEVDHQFNAYVSCTNYYWSGTYNASETNLSSITWTSGPLGKYYVPTNSPVVDRGSLTNSALAGLYHYTITGAKEGTGRLDMGRHYVAANNDGTATDEDGDGFEDYLDPDSDNDALNDAWEFIYFGNLSQNGSGDPDGDGVSNSTEYLQGRSPVLTGMAADGQDATKLRVFTPLR